MVIAPIVSNPTGISAQSASQTTTNDPTNPQGLNNMFLQLLVAQLQDQDPLNPMDPTQFVGQLAQFSELSEVTSIDQLLQQVVASAAGSGSKAAGSGQVSSAGGASFAPNLGITIAPLASAPGAGILPAGTTPPSVPLTPRFQGGF